MPTSQRPADDYHITHLRQLVGKRVRSVAYTEDPDVGDPVTGRLYGLNFDDGTTAWIMCDPEGNGPGHLDIQNADSPRG